MTEALKIDNHYLSQFYIKNFTNSDNSFFVYDKQKKEVLQGKKYPKSYFFEKRQLTLEDFIDLPNDITEKFVDNQKNPANGLENLLSDFENKWAKSLRNINNLTLPIQQVDLLNDVMDIVSFMSFFYWRLPSNSLKFKEQVANFNYNKANFKINVNKEPISYAMQEHLFSKNNDTFYKSCYLHFALDFMKKILNEKNAQNINVIEKKEETLLGDNPIFLERENKFIFPISKNRTLICIEIKNITANYSYYQDLLMLHNAEKYVICNNIEHLQVIVDKYFSQTNIDKNMNDIQRSLFD
jgi:hypothetical protein